MPSRARHLSVCQAFVEFQHWAAALARANGGKVAQRLVQGDQLRRSPSYYRRALEGCLGRATAVLGSVTSSGLVHQGAGHSLRGYGEEVSSIQRDFLLID